MLLKEIIKGLNIIDVKGSTDIEIDNIAYDSRKVRSGSLFVCVEGFKVDGHNYIPAAVENGAKVLLVQKEIQAPSNVTVVRVDNTRFALGSRSRCLLWTPFREV